MDVYIYIIYISIFLYTHVGVSWRFYSKNLTKQAFWNMVPRLVSYVFVPVYDSDISLFFFS